MKWLLLHCVHSESYVNSIFQKYNNELPKYTINCFELLKYFPLAFILSSQQDLSFQLWPDLGMRAHIPPVLKKNKTKRCKYLFFTENEPCLHLSWNLIQILRLKMKLNLTTQIVFQVFCCEKYKQKPSVIIRERLQVNFVALTNMLAHRNVFCHTAPPHITKSARIRKFILLVRCGSQRCWTIMWSQCVTVALLR